jgi:hypothetical protein
VCVFEDDDHWDSVQLNAKLTLTEMNAVIIIASPVVKLPDGPEVEFDVYAATGAELSNAGEMLCVSSCNGPFPCAICECKREELNPLKKPATRPKQRTLERIGLLSHTSCGTCIGPGCKMEIVATADVKDPAKQVIRTQAGDDEPTKQDWSEYLRKPRGASS